jgi:hypothetical protein
VLEEERKLTFAKAGDRSCSFGLRRENDADMVG